MTLYNNIPQNPIQSSSNSTAQFFSTFYQAPIELNGTDIIAVTGFFESRGFTKDAADGVAMIILSQAKANNLNAFQILDTLKILNGIELSQLVGQILNYNRFKTSTLGISTSITPADEIERNILA
jgi:hypothetical protein